jgi:hypothetical protein
MLAAIESRTKNPIDEEDIYLLATSAAYELQQLYTGFEKIVERHFEFTGVKAGPSPRYHKDLLLNAFNKRNSQPLATVGTSEFDLNLGFRRVGQKPTGSEHGTLSPTSQTAFPG